MEISVRKRIFDTDPSNKDTDKAVKRTSSVRTRIFDTDPSNNDTDKAVKRTSATLPVE